MNRYLLGAAIAGLVLFVISGLGGLSSQFTENAGSRRAGRTDDSSLGTLPIEQAGRVVQRQSQATSGIPATGTSTLGGDMTPINGESSSSSFTAPAGTGSGAQNPVIQPTTTNVIPQPSNTTPANPTGDISPVQPDLVRPETLPPTTNPEELDPIPALW